MPAAFARPNDAPPNVADSNLIYLRFAASLGLREVTKQKQMEERRKHPRTEID
jgi:hypothetical protein